MPGNVDEAKWKQAKALAAKQGHTDDYDYIMGIYKKLTKTTKKSCNNYMCEFTPEEVITKSGTQKKYLIKGYFSTIDNDLGNETVTMEAQKDILNQVLGRTITLDAEHEIFYDKNGEPLDKPASEIPIGKVIDAELTDKGVLGTVELNTDAPRFKNVWNSIKKGFLHSFSVAFIALEAVKKKVNGVTKSFVNKLNLINITLTGAPMNPMATFRPVMKSAVNGLLDSFDTYDANHNNEVNNMVEQEDNPQEIKNSKIEEVKEDPSPEVKPEVKTEKAIDFKSMLASLKSEFAESLKDAKSEYNKSIEEAKEGFNVELKSLKEKVEKLETQPVKKSIKANKDVMLGKSTDYEAKSVFDLM